MPVDFTKLPFSQLGHPGAGTLTEAIAREPDQSGFIVITANAIYPEGFAETIRHFARLVRANSEDSGLVDVTAYRQLRADELGGSVPFDQPVCQAILKREPQLRELVLENPEANWLLLLEYRTPEMALREAKRDSAGFATILANAARDYTVGAFRNMRRYSEVSRDPSVVQFFGMVSAPGDIEMVWPAWQEALPWFFDIGEIRSSLPLVALDTAQPLLLVNHGHCDSMKHFLHGVVYDPEFQRLMESCYYERGLTAPSPFFCKIVPV
jgi:hypothetical protein